MPRWRQATLQSALWETEAQVSESLEHYFLSHSWTFMQNFWEILWWTSFTEVKPAALQAWCFSCTWGPSACLQLLCLQSPSLRHRSECLGRVHTIHRRSSGLLPGCLVVAGPRLVPRIFLGSAILWCFLLPWSSTKIKNKLIFEKVITEIVIVNIAQKVKMRWL